MEIGAKLVRVRYAEPPRTTVDAESLDFTLFTDGLRDRASARATVKNPGVVRDALLTIGDVLSSDLRFKAQDRSDYLEYLLKAGKAASTELWNAQKAFLDAKYGEEEQVQAPLDPILTVSDDGVALEVFSRDESSYARLFLRRDAAFEPGAELTPGTTHVDFDTALVSRLAQIRSYRKTALTITPSDGGTERELAVPYRWIRAFSQVQAASILPARTFELAPVDIYNVLFTLKQQRARTAPRALRYELIPGQAPRLVLEPWDIVLFGTAGVYTGDRPDVLRTWGRKRLMALARLLPHIKKITVRVTGAGLPAIYVVDLGDATLTLALSGWVDSGWAGVATFDLLAADHPDDLLARRVVEQLAAKPSSMGDLATAVGREASDVRQAVLLGLQRGQIVHDIPGHQLRRRDLFSDPIDAEQLRYRDEHEADAHRLLERPEQVRLTKVHDLGVEGVQIIGEVEDQAAHRTYQTSFTLDREGRTVDASCTSPQYRRSGLREGPTVPMLALRLAYTRAKTELEKSRTTPEGRRLIRAETRTLIKRDTSKLTTYRVSLDERQIVTRWGPSLDAMRMQRMFFGSVDEAREAYFARLDELATKGFIDASAAEAI